jgi:hypothetical protein
MVILRVASAHRPGTHTGFWPDGETGIRTRDTTIFSRVLYQLSYLAAVKRLSILPSQLASQASR